MTTDEVIEARKRDKQQGTLWDIESPQFPGYDGVPIHIDVVKAMFQLA